MEFSVTSKVENEKIVCEIHAPEANEFARYAYYLYESSGTVLDKQGYIKDSSFVFCPNKAGVYYVKGFVQYKVSAEAVQQRTSKKSNSVLYDTSKNNETDNMLASSKAHPSYTVKKLAYESIASETFRPSEPTVYEIMWDNVNYEILINYVPNSKQTVIFGTGSIRKARQAKYLPIFSRARWKDDLPCTGIWYFDPTVYLSEQLDLAWAYGVNERWYLKDIALLLKTILQKQAVSIDDTLFFGSSGGGFTAILLATILRGKATAINPQLNVKNYSAGLVDRLKSTVLKDNEELISERVDVVSQAISEGYFPAVHLIQNVLAKKDLVQQITPFLNHCCEKKINLDNLLRIDFYSNIDGHEGMPSKEETMRFILEDLNWQIPTPRGDTFSY